MKPKTTRKNPSVQTSCSAVTTLPIPRRGPHAAMGIEILKLMKTKLSLIIALCAVFVTTSAIGQVTNYWVGPAQGGNGTNVDAATNWLNNVLPNTGNHDYATFDGRQAGNLVLNYNSPGNWQSGFGGNGIQFWLTSNQVGSVTINNLGGGGLNPPNLAFENVWIDAGAGAFTLGGPYTNTSSPLFNYAGRPAGVVHTLQNNSTNPATLMPNYHMIAGGGTAFTYSFLGTGDWQVNAYLVSDNTPASTVSVIVGGPGTVYWNPQGVPGANNVGTITVTNGMLVLQAPHPKISNQSIVLNGGVFDWDANAALSLSSVISGTTNGSLWVKSGTLTLSGASTYAAATVLKGGKLVANRAENPGSSGALGVGGTITFAGGTLAYTVLSSAADYSFRFSTNDNQAYSIDTSGDGSANSVTFSNALTSNGGTLTKLGSGTLTLAGTNANTYSGLTTISAGELLFQAPKSGSANITVADGATLGVFGNGSQVTPATLTLGTASGANLEFDNVSSTTLAPLAAGTISATGPITLNIGSGSFNTIGQVFPLFSWGSGSAPTVVLGTVNGANGTLVTNGNTLALKITATAYIYTGLNGGVWDLATANNWKQSGSSVVFGNGAPALFDDSAATGTPYVSLAANVAPSVLTINNNVINYTIFTYSGQDIQGGTGLTKSGNAPLAIYGPNDYTGVTTLNGGVTTVDTLDNGGAPTSIGAATKSAANLVLNGGTLQYYGGGASIDRSFTLGPSGGGIDSSGAGALNLTNTGAVALIGAGPHTLVLTGTDPNNDLFALSLTDSVAGATALTKNGLGTWVLTGTNNKYSGVTTVLEGTLQAGAGGAYTSLGSGSVVDNGTLIYNSSANQTNSLVTGSGHVTVAAGNVVLPGNNTYSGGTTISNGASLQIGTGGSSGSLNANGSIVNNGTIIFNSTSPITLSGGGQLSGTGNVVVRTGYLKTAANDICSGWTEIDPGATLQPIDGLNSPMLTSVITNNGTLKCVLQNQLPATFGISNNIVGTGKLWADTGNQNSGWCELSGTDTYTGGTFIGGGGLQIGDGITPGAGSIVGSVIFTNTTGPTVNTFVQNKVLIFSRPDNFTFTNNILSFVSDGSSTANSGSVMQFGPGTVTLTGNNSYPGGTTISSTSTNITATNACTLQVGNGGTTGSIGSGPVVMNSGSTLVFDRSDSVAFTNTISGAGSVVQFGSGTLTLSSTNNTYTGDTTVSNGTLVAASQIVGNLNVNGGTVLASNVNLNVNVNSGTFATAPAGTVGTLTSLNSMNISGGTVEIALDRTRSDITSYLYVITAINYTNGTLKLINAGPALEVGDTFTISYVGINGGNAMKIVSPGFTVTNNLVGSGGYYGTVTVTGITPSVAKITSTVSGGQLTLSWPSAWTGLHLQVQTNTLAQGLGNNWVNIPGSDAVNGYTNTINKANGSVFYRLAP
jgi:autotransporter-associated beta strand protein